MRMFAQLLLIGVSIRIITSCNIAKFEIDKTFTCGVPNLQKFDINAFPYDFVGTNTLTLGIWFKNLLYWGGPMNNGWIVLFKLTTANSVDLNRHPATYIRVASASVTKCYTNFGVYLSNGTYTGTVADNTITINQNSWYYATQTVNIAEQQSNFSIIDPSQIQSQIFAYYNYLAISDADFTYTNNHSLYFGSDNSTYPKSCIEYGDAFMITNYTPPTNMTLFNLAFGAVPVTINKILLQPYNVYENLFELQNNTLILANQGDSGLFWSANRSYYNSMMINSSAQGNLLALQGNISFINVNNSLSFSMRLKYYVQNYPSDTCSVYWLFRRISNRQSILGIGILPNGSAVVQIGSTSVYNSTFTASFYDWENLFFGCSEQWLTTIICIVYHDVSSNTSTSYFVFPSSTTYEENLSENIFLLGTGQIDGGSSSDTANCGTSRFHSLTLSQGAIIEPLPQCYNGSLIGTIGEIPKIYVRDSGSQSTVCTPSAVNVNNTRDCIPCPLGCSSCSVLNTTTLDAVCNSCSENFTLLSNPGICGCINNYYFMIDSVTNQGRCIPKANVAALLSNSSNDDCSYMCQIIGTGSFYLEENQIKVVTAYISVYLEGVLLSPSIDYELIFNSSNQLTVKLIMNASIETNSVLSVNFSSFNQIEGMPNMIIPQTVNFTITSSYAYLDPQTQQKLTTIGQSSAVASVLQNAATTSFSILLGGTSGAALFLLDAIGQLEMYKYLNVHFPRNFEVFYQTFYSSSPVPNIYAYISGNNTAPTSNYYKFADWQTPTVFISKYGDDLAKIDVAFLLLILTWIPLLLCSKKTRIIGILKKINYSFRWNLLISFLCGDFMPYLVHITLQFREAPFITRDPFIITSTCMSILILVSYLVIFSVALYQINRKRLKIPKYMSEARRKLKHRIKKEAFPKSLEVFSEEFKDDTAFDRNSLLLFKLKDLILSMNFIFMQEAPLAQCYIYTLITGFWLLMMMVGNPFKTKTGFAIYVFNEVVKCLLGVIAIVLATNDSVNFINQNSLLILGEGMIGIILGTLAINVLVAIGCLGATIYQLIKKGCCKKSSQGRDQKVYNVHPDYSRDSNDIRRLR